MSENKTSTNVAIIGGIVAIIVALITTCGKNKDTETIIITKNDTVLKKDTIYLDPKTNPNCIKKQKEFNLILSDLIELLNTTTNERKRLNILYYKEKIEDYKNYECKEIIKKTTKIDSVLIAIKNLKR